MTKAKVVAEGGGFRLVEMQREYPGARGLGLGFPYSPSIWYELELGAETDLLGAPRWERTDLTDLTVKECEQFLAWVAGKIEGGA